MNIKFNIEENALKLLNLNELEQHNIYRVVQCPNNTTKELQVNSYVLCLHIHYPCYGPANKKLLLLGSEGYTYVAELLSNKEQFKLVYVGPADVDVKVAF